MLHGVADGFVVW